MLQVHLPSWSLVVMFTGTPQARIESILLLACPGATKAVQPRHHAAVHKSVRPASCAVHTGSVHLEAGHSSWALADPSQRRTNSPHTFRWISKRLPGTSRPFLSSETSKNEKLPSYCP